MAGQTTVGFGDPKAAKRWSGQLFIDITRKSYFDKKFISTSDNAPIQRLTDLESDAGDTIDYDLAVQLRGKPTSGDNRLEGKEEALRFYSDQVLIDQLRHGVSVGGKMSRKRTVHDMRAVAKDKLSDYWSKYVDEMLFIYLSGARGINEDFIEGTAYAGHATNPIQAPDATHIIYPGAVSGKSGLAATDKMTKAVVEKAAVKTEMMRAVDPSAASMVPVNVEGEARYVCIMSPFQAYDMRTADTTGWLDVQKALATAVGNSSPIVKGGLGMINNVVLHSHQSAIRFSDYGAGSNVEAARALVLGRQGGVVAYGSSSGLRFNWTEDTKDHGNEQVIGAGVILGVKKSRFNSKDFGVLAVDTAAANPNP